METSGRLTPSSSILLQGLSSVLLALRLRFVPAASVSGTELTLDCLAIEGAKQIRRDAIDPLESVTAHYTFGGEDRRRCRLRRGRNLGEGDPANVRSYAKGRRIFMRLCQRY